MLRRIVSFRILAAVIATLSLHATSAVARAHRHGADLVVTEASVETAPDPPYLVESPDGRARDQHVDITVSIRNEGDRAADPSLGRVTLEANGSVVHDDVFDVGRLAPRKSHKVFLAELSPEVRLGLLKVYVTPNWNFHVPETRVANNRHLAAEIPVIANRWNVSQWAAESVEQIGLLKLDDDETAAPGFYFLFDHFDEPTKRFMYHAFGTFTDHTSYENPACIGSGSGSTSHSPWSSPSGLGISYDLTRYFATLDMSSEDRFTFTITCNPGGQRSTSAKFFDPLTYENSGGTASMSPSDLKLRGSGNIIKQFGKVDHFWIFKADAR
jgi:hypothetical protein